MLCQISAISGSVSSSGSVNSKSGQIHRAHRTNRRPKMHRLLRGLCIRFNQSVDDARRQLELQFGRFAHSPHSLLPGSPVVSVHSVPSARSFGVGCFGIARPSPMMPPISAQFRLVTKGMCTISHTSSGSRMKVNRDSRAESTLG